jgi:F420-dependent methylenetetrahydromethanopterin dehydrogenase
MKQYAQTTIMTVLQQTADKVITAISDRESLELFRIIAINSEDSDGLRTKTNLTRKQYYSRLSRMTKAGLVRRKKGKHSLTAFGKVIYDAQTIIEKAVNNYWRLKAIDSLEVSNDLPEEERIKLIDSLLDNNHIKEILYNKV